MAHGPLVGIYFYKIIPGHYFVHKMDIIHIIQINIEPVLSMGYSGSALFFVP